MVFTSDYLTDSAVGGKVMPDIAVRDAFRGRRVAGAALVFLSLPITLIWVRFGLPPQFNFGGFTFALGGPGLLAFGLWAAFPRRAPAVRLLITDDRLVVQPGTKETVIPLSALIQITKDRPLTGKHDRLSFETSDTQAMLNIYHTTHEAADIINLISIRLEGRGGHLVERQSDVLGAPTGVWQLRAGRPFGDDG